MAACSGAADQARFDRNSNEPLVYTEPETGRLYVQGAEANRSHLTIGLVVTLSAFAMRVSNRLILLALNKKRWPLLSFDSRPRNAARVDVSGDTSQLNQIAANPPFRPVLGRNDCMPCKSGSGAADATANLLVRQCRGQRDDMLGKSRIRPSTHALDYAATRIAHTE
jgi:hypothetical protein